MKKEYTYVYPGTKDMIFAKLKACADPCFIFNERKYFIRIMSENSFFLCVNTCSHSGGQWYVARVERSKNGEILIRGSIVEDPDENGKQRKPALSIVFLYVLLWPIAIYHGCQRLYWAWTDRKQRAIHNAEIIDNLNQFMLDYLGCCPK